MSKNHFRNFEVPHSMVEIPRCEYARLIAAKAKLDMIEKMVKNIESYAAYPVLKLLLTEEQDE